MAKIVEQIDLSYIEGMQDLNKNDLCRLSLDGSNFKIEHIKFSLSSKKEVLKTFLMPIERLASIGFVIKEETVEKQKSAIGRGVAGAVLFGPVGAIVGGVSGVGTKKSTKVKYCLDVAYYDKEQNMNTISFMSSADPYKTKKFAKYIQSKMPEKDIITQEENRIVEL